MSIKWRLTLSFAVPLAIAAVIATIFFYTAFRNWMIAREIDGDLKVYSTLALVPLATENVDQELVRSIWLSLEENEPASATVYLQLIDRQRNVLLKSENLGDESIPANNHAVDNALSGLPGIETVKSPMHGELRVQALPVIFDGETSVLMSAQSLEAIDPILERMGITLLVLVIAFLAMASASSAVLIGRALSPVKRVTETAQSIASSSDLTRRVNYTGPRDEVGRLAETFDHMIEQLDGLLQAQRSFVADASHELRGPLTVIRGNLDLLKRNMSEADRQESLRALESETNRMGRVVNDLLILAEIESSPLESSEPVSLKELLLGAQDLALRLAGDHRVVLGLQEDLWVKGDEHKLEQMVNNLVSNAKRYTPDGGTITLSLYREGEWACLEVADTGIGIPAEHLPRIFHRFYRVDKARSRATGGTGLGLAIVKGIVDQHGGQIAVDSEPGKGSTFTVRLRIG